MNFHGIDKDTLVNGDGVRVILWVAGCSHHCPNCHNEFTWDPNGGIAFTDKDYEYIRKLVARPHSDGLTLSGGDPMFPENRETILDICKRFRKDFGNTKTIWMYTGYTFWEIKNEPVLEYLDVIVDGRYIEDQRNINRQWVGSENQVVWRKIDGLWFAEEPKYADTIEQYNKSDCGGEA